MLDGDHRPAVDLLLPASDVESLAWTQGADPETWEGVKVRRDENTLPLIGRLHGLDQADATPWLDALTVGARAPACHVLVGCADRGRACTSFVETCMRCRARCHDGGPLLWANRVVLVAWSGVSRVSPSRTRRSDRGRMFLYVYMLVAAPTHAPHLRTPRTGTHVAFSEHFSLWSLRLYATGMMRPPVLDRAR